WHGARIEEQLNEALGRRVALAGGGSLVIDEREALTTIDVNSGRYIARGDTSLALRQNLLSCAQIARQIRLRNLGGIILIDFIDMDADAERKQVTELLTGELVRERGKTVLHGFTSLGLLEMTRKRTGLSLREALETPCKACGATGYIRERQQET
ncbi:MAG: ribonuclease E/G, partial [Eubacteriales bacterium]|nr:ribonuclease E/G [Eubacteriales bacterium]